MEREKGKPSSTPFSYKQSAGIILNSSFHLIWIVVFCYGGVYISNMSQRLDHVIRVNEKLQSEVDYLKKIPCEAEEEKATTDSEEQQRREIISASKSDLTSLLRGPPGPPGKDGRDGRDGKDFASLDLLRGVVNETVMKEWTQLSAQLPVYGGSVFTRWGRTSCPSSSTMIYRGQMTGKDYSSAGGGSNHQCIPDDPEYDPNAPTAGHSSLRATLYSWSVFSYHRVPCAVCETKERITQLMIPAKTRCPSSEWTLEYQGYLVSQAEHGGSGGNFVNDSYFAFDYVCVDSKPESLTSKTYPHEASLIYLVNAACSGRGALHDCPPYKSGTALSCVFCSK